MAEAAQIMQSMHKQFHIDKTTKLYGILGLLSVACVVVVWCCDMFCVTPDSFPSQVFWRCPASTSWL
jgi:hypothetical protein